MVCLKERENHDYESQKEKMNNITMKYRNDQF